MTTTTHAAATVPMTVTAPATVPPQIPGSTFEPVPPDFAAGPVVGWVLTAAIMVLAGGALVWAVARWVRHREDLPVFMWVGAFVAVVTEPIIDVLCHIWYAPDLPLTIVSGWGIHVPLLVGLAWAFFVGMTGYVGYRRMQAGMTARAVFALLGFNMLLDAALEYPALAAGAWVYYSDHPFELFGLPLWMAWINATGMILGGFGVWTLAPRLTGAWRAALVLCPGAGYFGSWTLLAWPNYLALEWNPPLPAKLGLSLLSLGLSLLVVRGVAGCVAPGARPLIPAATGHRPASTTA